MSDKELLKFYNDRFNELDKDIIEKSKETILSVLREEDREKISEAISKSPTRWTGGYHFNWGMKIRNLLRDKVCLDDKLATGNWDDYYAQCVEYALGLR
jgi:NADH:ubiquinone oxidoreductase subunit F (NADH-binding)